MNTNAKYVTPYDIVHSMATYLYLKHTCI